MAVMTSDTNTHIYHGCIPKYGKQSTRNVHRNLCFAATNEVTTSFFLVETAVDRF